jgi:hypothetical protein
MWGLAELGNAAEGLKKILEFAETVEDRVERARITDWVEQVYVLYFSPRLTKKLLEQVIEGEILDRDARRELWERLHDTERPVRRALDRIRNLGDRYRHVLTPDQWHSLQMISFGKLEIRRTLREVLHLCERGEAGSAKMLAAKLLDDMNSINALMDRTVSTVRAAVSDTRHLRSKGIRLSFWLILAMFVALWASVSVTVLMAANPLLELLRNLAP